MKNLIQLGLVFSSIFVSLACGQQNSGSAFSLGSAAPASVTGPAPVAVLNAISMAIRGPAAVPAGCWGPAGNGYLTEACNSFVGDNVTFPSSGTYVFNIQAYGSLYAGVGPNMVLMVDGVEISSISVNSGSPTNYALSATIGAGVHQIGIEFNNDAADTTGDRNLFLGTMTVLPQ